MIRTGAASSRTIGVLTNPALKEGRDFGVKRPLNSLIFPLQVGYRKRGASGIEVSDWFEHVGGMVDDLALVRSVWLTDKDHAAQYQFHTGRHIFDGSHPALGAWVKYALGSLNDDLPQYVAQGSPPGSCCGGAGAPCPICNTPEDDLETPRLPFTPEDDESRQN